MTTSQSSIHLKVTLKKYLTLIFSQLSQKETNFSLFLSKVYINIITMEIKALMIMAGVVLIELYKP